uniref:Uncharacterized protein n=1 Tax=Solanum tuberosum TaxID=4113 RepID=M1C155_SOLTU
MDKTKSPEVVAGVIHNAFFQASVLAIMKKKPPSLVSLCLGVIGRHFEDIIEDLAEIAAIPSTMKMALVAIARRRRLLNDDVIVALADSSWKILDLSGSEVSDFGLSQVVKTCKHLQAVDIRPHSHLFQSFFCCST